MEIDAGTKMNALHTNILPKPTKTALDFLSRQAWIKDSAWYLAGGTALALYAGHRKSYDLDFFTKSTDYDNNKLLAHFSKVDEWKTTLNKKNTIYGELLGAKISFIAYPFFIPKQSYTQYGAVSIIDALDIAVMKIIAISQRGRKRDFFDLFWCATNLEPLEDIIRKLPAQYPNVAHSYSHILASLVYFDDAEGDPEPEIFFDTNWKKVKDYFTKNVPQIAQQIITLDR